MKQAHIYIYGLIGNSSNPFETDNMVLPSDIQAQIDKAKDAEELVVHINSRGGNVNDGFAIHDMLVNSGKKIVTIGEGFIGSIATVPFLAGETRKLTEHSELMIHNPFIPEGGAGGDADKLKELSDDVAKTEAKVVDFYAKATGLKTEDLDALMKVETKMTAEEAKEKGFATEVIETAPQKAVAIISTGNSGSTSMESLANTIQGWFKALPEQMQKAFEKAQKENKPDPKNEPVARAYTLEDGTAIESDQDVELAAGQAVTNKESGEPLADGDYTLTDGTKFVVAAGKVESVTAPEEPPAPETEEAKALKAENDRLKAEKVELEKEMLGLKAKVEFIGKNMSSEFVMKAQQQFEQHQPTPGNNRFADRHERKKEYKGAEKQEQD